MKISLSQKHLFRLLIDVVLVASAFVLATFIRLEGNFNTPTGYFLWNEQLFKILPIIVALKITSFYIFGLYKRFWRYTDVDEILHLAKILAVPSFLMLTPRFFGLKPNAEDLLALSFGALVLDYLLSLSFLSGIRLFRWYLTEQRNVKKRLLNLKDKRKRTLIIGAGEAANLLIKTINNHPETGLEVVAALDDDETKHKSFLTNQVEVKGFVKDVKHWVDELSVNQIIIAIPSAKREETQKIVMLCNESGADTRTIPGVDQLAGGQVTVDQIRKLSMEDLLGRDQVDLNVPEVLAYLKGKRVLITGAGGSIGSELCRQLVAKCGIESLCLLGKGENSVFRTMNELNHIKKDSDLEEAKNVSIVPKICDIRNESRVSAIMEEFKPQVIFHAAAHKHVHLMELNACEAFENNVIGTRTIADLAGKHKVETFVLVSTDKAVNPTSIMGSTKSLAEQVTLATSKDHPGTRYTVVRFGNVLGSRGSVITVWEQQLRDNKPITVTHKEAIRFFMTIPEASQLVIQAGAKANNGDVMVLDMGTPIKILDLAKQFIQLAGFGLDEVPIDFIGLKEGEKLYEELLTDDEFIDSKLTDKIFKAKLDFKVSTDNEFSAIIDELKTIAKNDQQELIKEKIRALVKSKQEVAAN